MYEEYILENFLTDKGTQPKVLRSHLQTDLLCVWSEEKESQGMFCDF